MPQPILPAVKGIIPQTSKAPKQAKTTCRTLENHPFPSQTIRAKQITHDNLLLHLQQKVAFRRCPTVSVFLPPRERRTGAAVLICPGGGLQRLALATTFPRVGRNSWFPRLRRHAELRTRILRRTRSGENSPPLQHPCAHSRGCIHGSKTTGSTSAAERSNRWVQGSGRHPSGPGKHGD